MQVVGALVFSARGPRIEICTGPKIYHHLRLTDHVCCVFGQLDKALYSHLSRSPERIRAVSFVGNITIQVPIGHALSQLLPS